MNSQVRELFYKSSDSQHELWNLPERFLNANDRGDTEGCGGGRVEGGRANAESLEGTLQVFCGCKVLFLDLDAGCLGVMSCVCVKITF